MLEKQITDLWAVETCEARRRPSEKVGLFLTSGAAPRSARCHYSSPRATPSQCDLTPTETGYDIGHFF